ncbi:MAG: beta-Ala-His dipeptidase [Tissierellia bacterium]|nr:beta-Ala-His dipeptidase [Tissierellia bacterium]
MKTVMDYFKEISQIPRCSNDEARINEYLMTKAKEWNLEAETDQALNVLIRKPGTKGYENKEAVILQGHMDMVCVKEKDSDHDFSTDPLELETDGDILYAKNTTLGADNGIAVAMALKILEDDHLEHPPLEVVITTGEEIGLIGANAMSDQWLKGRRMINIDTEEEGVLTVGCAGGVNLHGTLAIEKEEIPGYFYEMEIYGLPGGHSGMEIHQDIPNGILVLAKMLEKWKEDIYLISFDGGSKHNAIPSEAKVRFATDHEIQWDDNQWNEWKEKYGDFKGCFKEIDKEKALDKTQSSNLLGLIGGLPHGPRGYMTGQYSGIVETSDNFAIVETKEDEVEFVLSIRSSKKDQMDELQKSIEQILKNHGASISTEGSYEPWEFKEDSQLQEICTQVYKEMFGKEMEVTVIHAGLECAVFESKYPHLDAVSIGPNMWDVHSPKERVSLSSVDRTYDYLVELLKQL